MRHSAGSHMSGARPFATRTLFVLSKARLSTTVALLTDGEAVTVSGPKTRRGLDAEVTSMRNESKRAVGIAFRVCARAFWPAKAMIRKRKEKIATYLSADLSIKRIGGTFSFAERKADVP